MTEPFESAVNSLAQMIAAHIKVCAGCRAIFASNPDQKSEAWTSMCDHAWDSSDAVMLDKVVTAIEADEAAVKLTAN